MRALYDRFFSLKFEHFVCLVVSPRDFTESMYFNKRGNTAVCLSCGRLHNVCGLCLEVKIKKQVKMHRCAIGSTYPLGSYWVLPGRGADRSPAPATPGVRRDRQPSEFPTEAAEEADPALDQ